MSESKKLYRHVSEAGLDDWRMLAQGIHARFTTGSFAAGLELLTAIGELAEAADHHPDVTLTYPRVDVMLTSHDVGHVTQRDFDLAARISDAARERGVGSEPDKLQQVELGLDSPDAGAVQPFWGAFLDFEVEGDEARDPRGQAPTVWFQESGSDEPRQRWHYDIWVPSEQVQPRLEAVRRAGGIVVAEFPEHSFWVVEDAQGNRSCVCTAAGRGE